MPMQGTPLVSAPVIRYSTLTQEQKDGATFVRKQKYQNKARSSYINSKRKAKDDAKLQEDHGKRAKVVKKSKSHVSSRKSEFNDLQVRKSNYSKEEGVVI